MYNEIIKLIEQDKYAELRDILINEPDGTYVVRHYSGSIMERIIYENRLNIFVMMVQDFNFKIRINDAIKCCKYSRLEILQLMLDFGFDIHSPKYSGNGSPRDFDDKDYLDDYLMWYSCKHGHQDVVNFLIDRGVSPDARGGGCLIVACKENRYSIVEQLIKYGANVTCKNNKPLYVAIANMRYHIVKLLLENGANMLDVNLRLEKIETENDALFKLLMEHNANPAKVLQLIIDNMRKQ
jgi:ankyrin repeat protein